MSGLLPGQQLPAVPVGHNNYIQSNHPHELSAPTYMKLPVSPAPYASTVPPSTMSNFSSPVGLMPQQAAGNTSNVQSHMMRNKHYGAMPDNSHQGVSGFLPSRSPLPRGSGDNHFMQNGLCTSSEYPQVVENPGAGLNSNGVNESQGVPQLPWQMPQHKELMQLGPPQPMKHVNSPLPTGNPTQMFTAASPLQRNENSAVPDSNLVPSTGLPLPYANRNPTTMSPQVTPGQSQPTSARSSRNPSPISSQRYDYMEGQFSNKPSPSNSSSNLINSVSSPNNTYPAQYQPNSYPSMNNANSPIPNAGMYGTPHSQPPRPVVQQPMSSNSPMPHSAPYNSPRYPQQLGYSQPPPISSPSMQSGHPGSLQQQLQPPTSPMPMYNSPVQQQSPYYPPNQPDGPVGGVAGYDPQLHAKMAGMSVRSGFSQLWGTETVNLLQDRNILPPMPLDAPKPALPADKPNCSPDIFRCTLTKIPDSSSLLQKSRLPLGILIHPFRDISNLSVIQCNTIVRCRHCRTYVNPFVTFVDQRRWKCNLCFRVNDLPEEFLYDPVTRSYGDPSRRPEIKNATMEFIAPSDYMLRPPQPAVYLFLLDVSHGACEIGYLEVFCKIMSENLDELPGDSRTRVGFVTFDGSLHFYNLAEGLTQPHMLVVSDVEDVFLPSPDNLLVNLHESKALIRDLLEYLPKKFANNWDSNSCLGAALQVAYKLMSPVGGRVTVIQANTANFGPGSLKNREDPNLRAAKDVANVGPASDFYKKLALECSSQQVAVDLFLLCSQYVDIATISCISKFSSGNVQYYPGFHFEQGPTQVNRFSADLKRYLTRRIGFEAVMRIRCTRGLAIHTFHGNFFVRSTDLLSLPNVSPDVGFGMQIAIEENLTDCSTVCFQAAVLYTSSHGERRIRVHTLSLPVVTLLQDVYAGADQEAIIGLVSKMAVDRSVTSSLSDARDALINVALDLHGSFKQTLQSGQTAGALMSPYSARLVPLFVLALLKHVAFRTGVSTKLDDRVFAMECMKTLPLCNLMKYVYPTLYPVHALDDKNAIHLDDDTIVPQSVILQLSSEKIDRHGVYLLDTFDTIYIYVGRAVSDHFCLNVLGVPNFSAISENMTSLPELSTAESERLRNFVMWLQDKRPAHSPMKIIREDSNARHLFLQYMLDDRTESMFSYYEFLQHLRQSISK